VVTADLRHSGILDLIVAEADSATVGVHLGNGAQTSRPKRITASASSAATMPFVR
jgi:hypothetical protein